MTDQKKDHSHLTQKNAIKRGVNSEPAAGLIKYLFQIHIY